MRSNLVRYVVYAPKGQLLSAQGRVLERMRKNGTLGMRVPAFYVRPVRAVTYPLRFYSAALTGRWEGECIRYPGRCPGLGVAGLSARFRAQALARFNALGES